MGDDKRSTKPLSDVRRLEALAEIDRRLGEVRCRAVELIRQADTPLSPAEGAKFDEELQALQQEMTLLAAKLEEAKRH